MQEYTAHTARNVSGLRNAAPGILESKKGRGSAEDFFMLYKLARFLQGLGLLLLPVGIAGNLAEKLTLWQSLSVSGVGVLVFYIGWSLQQRTGPR